MAQADRAPRRQPANLPPRESEIAAYGRNFHDDYEPVQDARRVRDRTAALGRRTRDLRCRLSAALAGRDACRLFPSASKSRGSFASSPAKPARVPAANHTDLDATARLFHYFRAQNNVPAARRALLGVSHRQGIRGRQPWTPEELVDPGPTVRVAARCE